MLGLRAVPIRGRCRGGAVEPGGRAARPASGLGAARGRLGQVRAAARAPSRRRSARLAAAAVGSATACRATAPVACMPAPCPPSAVACPAMLQPPSGLWSCSSGVLHSGAARRGRRCTARIDCACPSGPQPHRLPRRARLAHPPQGRRCSRVVPARTSHRGHRPGSGGLARREVPVTAELEYSSWHVTGPRPGGRSPPERGLVGRLAYSPGPRQMGTGPRRAKARSAQAEAVSTPRNRLTGPQPRRCRETSIQRGAAARRDRVQALKPSGDR